jgi:hypothetical protein
MNAPNISNMNYAELNQLRAQVAERVKEMRDTGITQLRATAQLLGVELKDLVPRKTRRRRKLDDGD